MDIKAPIPDDDDNASLATSLPGLSPVHSLASVEAMHNHDPEADEPPPYSAVTPSAPPVIQPRGRAPQIADEGTPQWSARDPRSSSTHSLTPEHRSRDDDRRKLLLVYLHGFMGDETSFQSFPAHVHNLVCVLLAETHVVHTKIYPRYRSRRAIAAAAEDFSKWLAPHESPNTDLVLLGHSMGGLVAAEVILLQSDTTQPDPSPLRHRILGNLNFDVPFLGMHPGIIGSGISSIFRAAPTPPPRSPIPSPGASNAASQSSLNLTPTASQSSSLQELPTDPNYNPMFPNDVRLPQRTGWQNAAHFLQKHGKNIRQAAIQVVNQHIEFGSCMYDFEGLKIRYSRIRMLDEENEKARETVVQGSSAPPRVRFSNYYTASTGRPKKPKKAPADDAAESAPVETASVAASDIASTAASTATSEATPAEETLRSVSHPIILTEEDPIVYEEPAFLDTASLPPDYSDIDFTSESESENLDDLDDLDPIDTTSRTNTGLSDVSSDTMDGSSPPLDIPKPQLPMPPVFKPPMKPPFNKEAYKTAVKTYKREVHEYHRAIVTYHQEMQAYRKQEIRRFKMIRKKSMDSIASSIDSRKAEIIARHEARKQEYNQRRAELNERLANARANRKQLIKMLKPRGARTEGGTNCYEQLAALHGQKADRKALKSLGKDERKLARAAEKEDRKKAKAENKALRKGRVGSLRSGTSISSASADGEASNSQTLWEQEAQDKSSPSMTSPRRLSSDASSSVAQPPPGPPPSRVPPPLPFRNPSVSTTQTSLSTATTAVAGNESSFKDEKEKPDKEKLKKDRRFCILPAKLADGARDPTWVRVHMEGVDEVGAHCGLFFPRGPDGNERSDSDVLEAGALVEGTWSDRYAQFVGDVAERIEGWVLEDMTMRLVMAAED